METNITTVMGRVEPYLDTFESILRYGHETFESYPPHLVVDYDASTQAHVTNRHSLAKAHDILDAMPLVRHIDVRGQQLWLIESANVVVRFKKTDEDGRSSNYPTSQAKAFDRGEELPGVPEAPTRITAGYLLDETGIGYKRSQVSLPNGNEVDWCAAIVPLDSRQADEAIWYDVTRQPRFG